MCVMENEAGQGEVLQLRDAPLFHPTEEEFRDPLCYIRSVQAQAYEFGIFRIQPPASWRPPKIFHRHRDAEMFAGTGMGGSGRTNVASDDTTALPAAADLAANADGGEPDNAAAAADADGGELTACPSLTRMPSAADYTPIGCDDAFEARLQAIRARPTAGKPSVTADLNEEAQAGRPGGFICAFTPKYQRYSLSEFEAVDKQLRADCFPDCEGTLPPAEKVEQWFWDGLASEGDARILYCSDLDGTAFPQSGKYGEHPWSLQRIADAERSLLRFVEYAIPGVNTPMLYFGMLFAMFCWHVEDQYMYSTSYLHEGACKTWYGVSSRDAERFEACFSATFDESVKGDPELFIKKASMVPPWKLLSSGVPVCRAVQEPGQFVVTLPQGYHAGFSHGFNTAEAVNFMLHDWLPYAASAMARYQRLAKEPVIDVDQILVRAAQADHSPEVHAELARVLAKELEHREAARAAGCVVRPMGTADATANLGRSPPCEICGCICHFSFAQYDHVCSERLAAPVAKRQAAGSALSSHLPALVCARHCTKLKQMVTEGDDEVPALTLELHVRYDDATLAQMAQDAASAAHATNEGCKVASWTPTLPKPSACASGIPEAVKAALQDQRSKKLKRPRAGGLSFGMQMT